MICEKCNKEIDTDSIYCKYCGNLIENKEVIKIKVKDLVKNKEYFIEINKDSTYKEFLSYLFSKGFIKFSRQIHNTIKMFSIDGSICFRDNELLETNRKFDNGKLDDYFIDNCEVIIFYDDSKYIDPRNFICLYGCPRAKEVDVDINIKEGNL